MKVIWVAAALDDLTNIREYIAVDDPQAARKLLGRILDIVETHLAATPHVGRPGRVDGTRELVIPGTPFIVPYRVKDRTIQILRVYHSARKWPEAF